MFSSRITAVLALLSGALAAVPAARAQEEIAASLPWTFGQTAGGRAQIRGEPTFEGDIWVVEDFTLDRPYQLTRFSSIGTVNPLSFGGMVEDVAVLILDGPPPEGTVILESVAGAGSFIPPPPFGSGVFLSDFGQQRLGPGSYIIMWAAVLKTTEARSIAWHQPGPHAVGGGEPDNAYWWNPFTLELIPIPRELGGGGRTGINFILRGIPDEGCYADCDENGNLDFFDFLCFQNAFLAGDPYADCDNNGVFDFFDFLCFQNQFLAGCP